MAEPAAGPGADTGAETAALATFDLGVFNRFADLAVQRLGEAREEIDSLNVYPVPDGDTGTNMYLTVEAARDGFRAAEPGLQAGLRAYGRAALLGARGNSGVILSQLIGALLRRMGTATEQDRAAVVFADGMRLAADAAYAAVGTPVEGTILTVARAAADAALEAAAPEQARLAEVVTAAAAAAHAALDRTPEQLQTLRDAGVVDAGGRGLCVVLDAALEALTGRREQQPTRSRRPSIPTPLPSDDLTEGGPAYEVMYLLDAADEDITALRSALAPLGDSLVVVGGDGLWHVHVHVDDVGAAVEAGIEVGRPRRIRVTHFAEQVARARRKQARRGRAVVAVAAGPGLARLFTEAGARVLNGGPGHRPSTGQVLEAIAAAEADEVIVLPNDSDSVRVCEAAASAASDVVSRCVVIPTRAQVQGIAALAVHEPGRSLEDDVVAMTSAARHARHGAVTVAARQAMTSAGPCEPGDVLGVLEGDFVVVGESQDEVARRVLETMLSAGGELVTLVAGAEGAALAEATQEWVEAAHQGVDVVVYDGGQERYPLLMAVE